MKKFVFFTLTVLSISAGLHSAHASESSVHNDVSFTVSTGNRTVESGEQIATGDAQTSISIETIVDGNVVEDIDKTIKGDDAYEYHTTQDEGDVYVETYISSSVATPTESTYYSSSSESQSSTSKARADAEVTYALFKRINSFMTHLFTYVTQAFL